LRSVDVEFYTVVVWVVQIESLGDAVVGKSVEGIARVNNRLRSLGQFKSRRVEDGDVIESSKSFRSRWCATTSPSIEGDMMMVSAG
jgi:hypothetical protein